MGKQTFDRIKKSIATLLVVFFVLSMTSAAVGAVSFSGVLPTGTAFANGADVTISGTGMYAGLNYGMGVASAAAVNSISGGVSTGGAGQGAFAIAFPSGIAGAAAATSSPTTGLSILPGTTGNIIVATSTSTSHIP